VNELVTNLLGLLGGLYVAGWLFYSWESLHWLLQERRRLGRWRDIW
jgi:hypothetical protein